MEHPADTRIFIAVIDDSPTVCKILQTCLSRENHVVQTFTNPTDAYRAFFGSKKRFPLPNILFVDMRLQHAIDGIEVIKRFRNAPEGGDDIHIIVVSRLDSFIDKIKARLAGANLYFTKPFKTQDIVAVVQQYERASPSEDAPSQDEKKRR